MYYEDYDEGYFEWKQKEAKRAYDSYPSDIEGNITEEIRHCWKCGAPLVYDSMSYHEGFHFDSCD